MDDDVFAELPWLTPPERWHPDAGARIEEARRMAETFEPREHGLELWAFLGALTQADCDARARAANGLSELYRFEESVPAWPVLARCLMRLASAEVPGRYWAAGLLLDLVTDARRRGTHGELLTSEELELELGRWNDEGRRPFRDAIRSRVVMPAGPPSHDELMSFDLYVDHAARFERARLP